MNQKPSTGRIVHFTFLTSGQGPGDTATSRMSTRPAIVTSVDPDSGSANLTVFLEESDSATYYGGLVNKRDGSVLNVKNVPGDESLTPVPNTWRWPPRT